MAKIKYGNKREYLDFYGAAMAARFGKAVCRMRADVLVPVPIHPSRRRARGFNQAEVLADEIGRRLGVPVYPNLLVRTKKTAPQKELSAAERLKNLSGAFCLRGVPGGAVGASRASPAHGRTSLRQEKAACRAGNGDPGG